MNVNVALAAGGAVKTVIVPERATIEEVIAAAGISVTTRDKYLVGGKTVEPGYTLHEGETLLVTPPITGGAW